ncbi:MAG TPA: glycosyltransferase family 2 protein [Nocardioides sp.]|nr:glycosyltransferase family 2 protein [Nocardioides sp.]
MYPTVTALLVSHDGARWLPAVLDAVAAQTRAPSRLVAVDTGSTDGSAELVGARADRLHELPARTGYGDALATALAALPETGEDEWVWLLHDDSAPAPDALEALLSAAEADPGVDILGTKVREWPSLRRLLEVGVTIGPTGRRETGLERGEYDQGQHDEARDVLAVNTAGMLVRRRVLEELGLDRHLPVLGADLDLGWRAARAGHRTQVVPGAVVFHVEASHRGVRSTPLTGSRPRRTERAAALFTLLANGPAGWLPLRVVRLVLGGLVRALGFLLVRAPGEAWDELVALASVLGRPWRIASARRRRRATAVRGHREVRHLLAPFWLPYRHGLDFLSDVATAVAHQAGDMSAARRAARGEAAADAGPVPDEAESLPEDTGLVARTLRSPVAWVMVGLLAAAVVAGRRLLGGGVLAGGALLPAPGSALDWWGLYLASTHDLGTGSAASAAPYVLPLAALGTALLGKASLAVDVLVLLAVPLAAFAARRFLLRLGCWRPAALWGGVVYGLLPVLGGAVQQGRLGTVVAAVVLPWLAHAALFLAPTWSEDRRRRAAWRSALLLALMGAFAPVALPLAAVLVGVLVTVVRFRRGAWPDRGWIGTLVLPVPVAALLLLPWTATVWTHQGAAAWLFEAGLPAPHLTAGVSRLDLVLLRPGSEGAPWWALVGVGVAALGALARPDTRGRVLAAWAVLVVGLLTAAGLSGVTVAPATSAVRQPVWLGVPLLLAGAAAVCAAAVAGSGIRGRLAGRSFGWRQPTGAAIVVIALVTPLLGLGWWAVTGSDGPLARRAPTTIPAYMTDAATADSSAGVLVVRGDRSRGFTHLLVRGPGLRLGQESVLPTVAQQEPLTDLVGDLVTAPEPSDAQALADLGVRHVYAPPPVDGQLSGNLDALSGLTTASATLPDARAWQVQASAVAAPRQPDGLSATLHPWLLGAQALLLLGAAVAAAPTREVRR